MSITSWLRGKDASIRARKVKRQTIRQPRRQCLLLSLEILEDQVVLAGGIGQFSIYKGLADGLDTQLTTLQTQVNNLVYDTTSLPFVGNNLQNSGNLFNTFSKQMSNALRTLDPSSSASDIQNALFQVLGSRSSGFPSVLTTKVA